MTKNDKLQLRKKYSKVYVILLYLCCPLDGNENSLEKFMTDVLCSANRPCTLVSVSLLASSAQILYLYFRAIFIQISHSFMSPLLLLHLVGLGELYIDILNCPKEIQGDCTNFYPLSFTTIQIAHNILTFLLSYFSL